MFCSGLHFLNWISQNQQEHISGQKLLIQIKKLKSEANQKGLWNILRLIELLTEWFLDKFFLKFCPETHFN